MKRHSYLRYSLSILVCSIVFSYSASAQIADPWNHPDFWIIEISYCDSVYGGPGSSRYSRFGLEERFPFPLHARGWFMVRFDHYPFSDAIQPDSGYHWSDMRENDSLLKSACSGIETSFGRFEFYRFDTREFILGCYEHEFSYFTDSNLVKNQQLVQAFNYSDTSLPYFLVRFDNFVGLDDGVEVLAQLPYVSSFNCINEKDCDMKELIRRISIGRTLPPLPYKSAQTQELLFATYLYRGDIPITSVENLERVKNLQFYCYPNPASSGINVEVAGNIEQRLIRLFTMEGELVLEATMQPEQELVTLPSENLNSGVYVVIVGEDSKLILLNK